MRTAVAETLRDLRRRARLSQKGLADLSGVSDATIGLIERGKSLPLPETLQLLARGLATDADGALNDALAADYTERLLITAGYLQPRSDEERARPSARHQLYDFFQKHPDLAESMSFLTVGELAQDDVDFIVGAVEYVRRKRRPSA